MLFAHLAANAAPMIFALIALGILVWIPVWLEAAADAIWLGVVAPKDSRIILAVFAAIALSLGAMTGMPALSLLLSLIITPFFGVKLANDLAWWRSKRKNIEAGVDMPRKKFLLARRRRELAQAFEPPPTLEL